MAKQNVILFGIDSLWSDHMSCYGYNRLTTPHIDKFATQGVLFENTFSAHIPHHTGLCIHAHGYGLFFRPMSWHCATAAG